MVNRRWSEWSRVNHRNPATDLDIGESVLLKRPPKSENDMAAKYGKMFVGPGRITKKLNQATYELELDGRIVKAHNEQLRR